MFELTWYMFWWFDAEVNLKFYTAKYLVSEAVVRSCSVKKVFLEISQNSQENTCARVSFLIKLQASGLQLC